MRVIIESPYAGDTTTHLEYVRRAMLHSLLRGESPVAFHMLYPQVLNDSRPDERAMGLRRSWEFYPVCDLVAVYTDYGISAGMEIGISKARVHRVPVSFRKIGVNP